MSSRVILIVEDNESFRAGLVDFLTLKKFKVLEAESLQRFKEVYKKNENKINLILSDLKLPDGNGIQLLEFIKKENQNIPFIFMTAQPDVESAIKALKAGAYDYLIKPFDIEHLLHKIESCLESTNLKKENEILKKKISSLEKEKSPIIGNSEAIQRVIEKAKQLSPTDITILIQGESGTGKEIVANFIHQNSLRKEKIFLKVNCGAIVKSLMESELFGVIKGAYTGADRDRTGLFESANGGTIFLDEIGELDLESQVRLLRVIEEKNIMKVGSSKPIPVDVRIITATNKDLLKEVENGNFREDLYYRLAVAKITLPPLRERKDDILLLFNYFVIEFNEKYQKSVTNISPDVLKFFQNYSWPGNIRQFRNVLESMVILSKDDILTLSDLPEELLKNPASSTKKNLVDTIIAGIPIEEYEKAIIEKNLEFTNGNREKAAKLLGVSERTLYRKINEYKLK